MAMEYGCYRLHGGQTIHICLLQLTMQSVGPLWDTQTKVKLFVMCLLTVTISCNLNALRF